MKKHIVITVTNDLTYDQRMQKTAVSLSMAGYAVTLIGRQLPQSIALSDKPYQQTRLRCIFNQGKLFYLEYNLRLFFFLLRLKLDIVCAVDLDTIVPSYFAAKIKGGKLVYDAHEYFTEVPEVINRPLVKKTWEWVERTFVPKADLIYTVSPTLAKLFSEKYHHPVGVILNAPLLIEEGRMEQQHSSYILYQGALNEGRGIEAMIDAMKQIDMPLWLAGEGDLSASLRKKVKDQNLENKVIFLGYVSPEKLKAITPQATIGINLLENKGLSYYYSLSNKYFDYLQARIPQVCIAFPEYVALNENRPVAVLVKDCQPDAIIEAISRLLNDKVLYAEIQKNCDFWAGKLNWQNEEQKLLQWYEKL
jgi:glycosyltransferase involved in cell wall biosynthesis